MKRSIRFITILLFAGSVVLYGQSTTELPNAPVPMMESSSSSNRLLTATANTSQVSPTPAPTKHRRWLTTYNGSLLTLVVGETIDSLGTYKNMTHTKWICGFDPVWPTGGYAISTGDQITYNADDVKSICGVSPTGMQPNYMFDVTQTDSFTEAGWAAKWGLTGNRNFAGVEAWNLGNDVAQALLAHYLHKKGGWRGKVGTAMNYCRGIGHLWYGLDNFRYVSQNRTPDEWVNNNSKGFTNWPGPYWWGKKQ